MSNVKVSNVRIVASKLFPDCAIHVSDGESYTAVALTEKTGQYFVLVTMWKGDESLFFSCLDVDANMRGNGTGTRIVKNIARMAGALKINYIYFNTDGDKVPRVNQWYQSLGFHINKKKKNGDFEMSGSPTDILG